MTPKRKKTSPRSAEQYRSTCRDVARNAGNGRAGRIHDSGGDTAHGARHRAQHSPSPLPPPTPSVVALACCHSAVQVPLAHHDSDNSSAAAAALELLASDSGSLGSPRTLGLASAISAEAAVVSGWALPLDALPSSFPLL